MKQEEWDKMIKDALEQHASNNPPYEGHELRFEQRLKNKDRQNRIISLRTISSIAAALVLGVGLWMYMAAGNEVSAEVQTVDAPPQVAFAKEYFQQNALIDVSQLDYQDEKVSEFLEELTQLEKEYHRLDSLYRINVSNELLIKGMVDNFRYRLTVMQKIKSYIEFKKSNQKNENI